MEVWVVGLVMLPIMGCLIWWWNYIWYLAPVRARCSSFNVKLPPGELGIPFFGENFKFLWFFLKLRRPDDFIASMIHKYGDNVGVYRTYLYGSPSIIACSPSLCKFILNSTDLFVTNWPTTDIIGPNAVIALHGARHGLMKSCIINATTNTVALARIVSQVQPRIVAALQSWSEKGTLNTSVEAQRVILDCMGRSISGLEFGQDIDAFVKLFYDVHTAFRAQPLNIPGTAYYRAVKSKKKLINFTKQELKKRKLRDYQTSEKCRDLMDTLLQLKDKEENHLSDEEVLDNILNFLTITLVAIPYTVTWAMYLVTKNPQVLQKLREENGDMRRKKNGKYITYEDISKLKYTNKVVEETLRIANLSGFVFRKATQDVQYQGYMIPKGWNVIVWMRHLHTNPKNFEDPQTFNPDRWDTRPKKGTYLPFGGGPKSCPGGLLAKANIVMFLHHLSIGYKWKLLNTDAPIKYLSHPLPIDGLEISISNL